MSTDILPCGETATRRRRANQTQALRLLATKRHKNRRVIEAPKAPMGARAILVGRTDPFRAFSWPLESLQAARTGGKVVSL